MAYTPNNWECGDTVTAEKLNNLEEGIQEALECCGGGSGDGLFVIKETQSGGDYICDKTWQEVYDAMEDDRLCVIIYAQKQPELSSIAYQIAFVNDVNYFYSEEYGEAAEASAYEIGNNGGTLYYDTTDGSKEGYLHRAGHE